MFKNYLKTAWRNLLGNRVYSVLNILGLGIGMAVALLIGLWVHYQYSYDRWLPGADQAYQVLVRYNSNDGVIGVGRATPTPLATALKKDIPGIACVANTDFMGSHSLMVGDKRIYEGGVMAGPDFLKILPYPMVKGNAADALSGTYSIVLTQSAAKSLFGSEDVMGKSVRIDNSHDLVVTGILRDLPENSTHQFDFIVPWAYNLAVSEWLRESSNNWRNYSILTFVGLRPDADPEKVNAAVGKVIARYNPVDYKVSKPTALLHPLKKWHLYTAVSNGTQSGGMIQYVRTFTLIGALVLLIACINFTNLSTARSEHRAREVGVRKAIGSQRRDLIFQFLIESLLITTFAAFLGCLLVQTALPAFNVLTRSTITLPLSSPLFWMIMMGYILLTGLLAGSRPAFYLSSFRPVKVLKGVFQVGKGASLPRKILVVMQFTCSIALIISTIIIYQQIQHARTRPTGYDADRLVMTDANGDINKNYVALKQDLLHSGLVSTVTKSSNPVTEIWSNQRIDDWDGKRPNESLGLATIAVSDADYFRTMGMEIKEGRDFTGDRHTDSLDVILNEAAVKQMRYKNAINQIITWHDNPQRIRVIGVVKDALMASPFAPAEPSIFIYDPNWASTVTYRISPSVSTASAISGVGPIFSRYNPSYPFGYQFVDESYADKFRMETLIGTLSGLFAVLAIFISGLGLFGLAAYMAERRTKEIGIRKVLGASVPQVWLLLSREFVLLVGLSCVIASPIAWYFLNEWLHGYNYRISIGPGVFILSALMAIVVTILTISWQAIRAALMNPVKSLRSE